MGIMFPDIFVCLEKVHFVYVQEGQPIWIRHSWLHYFSHCTYFLSLNSESADNLILFA